MLPATGSVRSDEVPDFGLETRQPAEEMPLVGSQTGILELE